MSRGYRRYHDCAKIVAHQGFSSPCEKPGIHRHGGEWWCSAHVPSRPNPQAEAARKRRLLKVRAGHLGRVQRERAKGIVEAAELLLMASGDEYQSCLADLEHQVHGPRCIVCGRLLKPLPGRELSGVCTETCYMDARTAEQELPDWCLDKWGRKRSTMKKKRGV